MWTRLRALRGRRWLIALCVAGAVVEAGVLRGVGFVESIPLAPQVTAPPPYGVFHDLRWLIVYHDSWTSLVWELALLVALRGLLMALLVRLAWPAAIPRPSWPSLVGRGVGLALASTLLLSPGATTAFAGGVTSLSWFLPGVLVPLFVTVLVLPRGGFHRGWWRRPPSLRAIWISALTFLVLSVGALVLTASPGWLVLPVAAAIGGYNAWAWTRLLATARQPVPHQRVLPVGAGLRAFTAVGVLVAAVAPLGVFRASSPPRPSAVGAPPAGAPDGPPLLVVTGFNSSYAGHPQALFGPRYDTERYSYRGIGGNGEPLPYGPAATHQSLGRSARLLARELDLLHRRTGRPVDVVAVSEGTAVVRVYLATHPRPPLSQLVLMSPLVRPSRVAYPAAGQQGWGLGGAWEARGLLFLAHLEYPSVTIRADSPFIRSFVTDAGVLRDRILCPVAGVRLHVFLPLASAVVAAPGPLGEVRPTVVPAFHGGLLRSAAVRAEVAAALSGRAPPPARWWQAAYAVVRGAASAWEAPSLPLAWIAPKDAGLPDPAFGQTSCRPQAPVQVRAANRRGPGTVQAAPVPGGRGRPPAGDTAGGSGGGRPVA